MNIKTPLMVRTSRQESVAQHGCCVGRSIRCADDEMHAEAHITPCRGMQNSMKQLHLPCRSGAGGEAWDMLHASRGEASLPCRLELQGNYVVCEAVHKEEDLPRLPGDESLDAAGLKPVVLPEASPWCWWHP